VSRDTRDDAAPKWNRERPHTLVVACSDGRLQTGVDDFLQRRFDLVDYDRFYIPGGAGALAASGLEFLRATRLRRECEFLLVAHSVEHLILLFHGPAADGPGEAVCADYSRKMPAASPAEIRAQQDCDAEEVLRRFGRALEQVVTHVFRCEVAGDRSLHFQLLHERLCRA